MPIISGIIIIDETKKTLTYTGSVTHTSQTFTFNEKQDQISIKNLGSSPITLTVESRSYIILTNTTTTINGEITFFNLMSRGLVAQSFELTSYAYLDHSNGGVVINDPQFVGNATFVEDRLDSTNKTTALSANQGRSLNDKINGLYAMIGDLTKLLTSNKTDLTSAINELKVLIGAGGIPIDTTPPNDVTNLIVSNTTTTSLMLSWTPSNSSDVYSYDIYNGSTFLVNTTNSLYTVTGLTAATSYTFTVKAKDTSGNAANGTSITTSTNAIADTTPPIVTIAPLGGTYSTTQSIVLSANEQSTIYYTLDGSTPTINSLVYNTPISISATTTIKYFAKDTAGNATTISSQTYTISSSQSANEIMVTWVGGIF